MQYTPHYNLNLPEGTDIVNPLVQDNPNYTAIDSALYNNKLRVIGTATHVKTGTNHAITLGDSDIDQFKFVATGDYAAGDTFTVDGVTVTARIADGSSIPSGAFKINSTVLCILDGTVLNFIGVYGKIDADSILLPNNESVEDAISRIDADIANQAETVFENELATPFDVVSDLLNPYTVLKDGYLMVATFNSSDSAIVRVYGASTGYFLEIRQGLSETGTVTQYIFLKKGMRIAIDSKTGGAVVKFIPLY